MKTVMEVSGECVIFSVLSCNSKNLKQQTDQCYIAQFYLASKGKYILEA